MDKDVQKLVPDSTYGSLSTTQQESLNILSLLRASLTGENIISMPSKAEK